MVALVPTLDGDVAADSGPLGAAAGMVMWRHSAESGLGQKQIQLLMLLTECPTGEERDPLDVARSPKSAQELSNELRELQEWMGEPEFDLRWDAENITQSLRRMERRGLVERIPVTKRTRGTPKFLWRATRDGCEVAW
jgi:DNA-binding MarR family transcriptional regulator